jgi:hypothetical protein
MKGYYVTYKFPDGETGYLKDFYMGAVRYTYDIEDARLFDTWAEGMTYLTPQITRMVAGGMLDAPKRFQLRSLDEELVGAFA